RQQPPTAFVDDQNRSTRSIKIGNLVDLIFFGKNLLNLKPLEISHTKAVWHYSATNWFTTL
ncbi:MAG: hypothetical protein OSA87_07310, partial [Woeseiaceae bacterium]|nr:hypothetical protein [Woeseiaceae bacterium]